MGFSHLAIVLSVSLCGASAAPTFANLFHGGAVLQRETVAKVWGVSGRGGVKLYIDGVYVVDASVDASGNWTADVPSRPASFGNKLLAAGSTGNSSVDISFGDVLLCSGQSNMDMPLSNKLGGFQADNGSAEVAASTQYTGKIWLWKQVQSRFHNKFTWLAASPQVLTAPNTFSAVCWYSGTNYFNRLGGKVPVGLMQASVGGSPIEYWLSREAIAKCEVDQPACDKQFPDSTFYDDQIAHLQPYTFGALVWDQAERDLKCNHVGKYTCMQKELARSWRSSFSSPHAAFVVVQLPDYFDKSDPGTSRVPGYASTAEGVFAMRLAQEAGVNAVDKAAAIVTYDQSCNDLSFPKNCPFGSVHNIHKQIVGERVSAQLQRLMRGGNAVTEGPRAQDASVVSSSSGYSVTVRFKGGSEPFSLRPTRNCTACCEGARGDFDASHDGKVWGLGSNVEMKGHDSVVFHVALSAAPLFVRYTAGSNFTQCALYNKEAFPAWPFQMKVTDDRSAITV